VKDHQQIFHAEYQQAVRVEFMMQRRC